MLAQADKFHAFIFVRKTNTLQRYVAQENGDMGCLTECVSTYRDRKLKVRSPDNSTHVCKVKGSNCAKRYDRQRCDVISSADDAGMKKLMVTV